jgi:MFS transporter, UMF1 family
VSDIDSEMGDSSDSLRYDGEDTRPTSRKELWGWYSYGWAAETFVIVVMASFMPITLEQLARENGVLRSDTSTPCEASWKPAPTSDLNGTLSTWTKDRPKELPSCVVYILGVEVNTASFAMYTFSISVLVQALLIISMSGAADHGRFRKTFLLILAVIGSVATMLFIFVVPKIYLLGSLLAIIGNTCFGASFVLLNSFLPLLVRYHPSVLRSNSEDARMAAALATNSHAPFEDEQETTETSALLPQDVPDHTEPAAPVPAAMSPELRLSTHISSYGIGIGYLAGLLVQMMGILIIVATGSTTFSLRLVLLLAGSWWLFFTIPAALWLRPRPGPPLPYTNATWITYITYAWKSLFKTIGRARQLKDIVIFLGAWFLLSDSIATVSGTAVLFAKTQLGMNNAKLGLINVIATIAGVIGAFCWSSFSRLMNLRPSQTIVVCIAIFEIIPLYGLLGFIPAVQNWGVIGLQQAWEMYPLGAVYGFVLGGLSSYCRAFFGELIPPGFEASFYALYAITDKGSSVLGPAVVGAITDRYGEIRPAFVFLAVLIALPLPLMLLVDVDRGKTEAKRMADELEGRKMDEQFRPIPTIRLPDEDLTT